MRVFITLEQACFPARDERSKTLRLLGRTNLRQAGHESRQRELDFTDEVIL